MKKGFTLLELIIVVVIMGILATFALPRYFRQIERARGAAGLQLIGTLRSGEILYKAENGGYTATCADLDVNFAVPKGYDTLTCVAAAAENVTLVSIQRNHSLIENSFKSGADYTLAITGEGTISCTGDADSCSMLGY